MNKETIKYTVMQVLDKYPEARETQINFIMSLCQYLGIITISELQERGINLVSYVRSMQHIQNILGLYQASEDATKGKIQAEQEESRYFANEKAIIGNIKRTRKLL